MTSKKLPTLDVKNTLIFLAIILLGIASRIWLVDSPNFKPVAALALFAGFYFRSVWPAILAITVTLIGSDLLLGVYETPVMIAVYASTALAIFVGVLVKRRFEQNRNRGLLFGKFAVASLAVSVSFFMLTNFAVWAVGGWYPQTLSGLADCFLAAIPFFRWTLISDFVFGQILVTAYCIGLSWAPAAASQLSVSEN
jgi:hypothetical protein